MSSRLGAAASIALLLAACLGAPRGGGVPLLVNARMVDAAPAPAAPSRAAGGGLFVYRDQVYAKGPLAPMRLSWGDDRFFAPALSPDRRLALFTGLATGVHVVRVVDAFEVLRVEGTEPAWMPGAASILFERTEDDGHAITAGDLFLASIGDGAVFNLTRTPGIVERRPRPSPDGKAVYFEAGGARYRADLAWREP